MNIADVLTKAGKKRSNTEKAEVLKENDNLLLRFLLQANFDPKFELNVPGGMPPDMKLKEEGSTTLVQMIGHVMALKKGAQSDRMNMIQKEQLLTKILTSVSKDEAEAFAAATDGKLTENYRVTRKSVDEAFPGLIPTDP